MLTLRTNGKKGKMSAIIGWLGKLVIGCLIALLPVMLIQAFVIWRDLAIVSMKLSEQTLEFRSHRELQDRLETKARDHEVQMRSDVAVAKKIVDDSISDIRMRLDRIERVCCMGGGR